VDELISSVDQLKRWQDTLKDVDGILAIHLTSQRTEVRRQRSEGLSSVLCPLFSGWLLQ
jgi:hypothetical protein